MAASASRSACGSAAKARGVSRNILRDIWSSTITAASAVRASTRKPSLPRDTRISCEPRKRRRMLASKAGSFSNHWSGSVCSNQNFKTSSTHPSIITTSVISRFWVALAPRRRLPPRSRLGAPRWVRQLCDQEISERGNLGWTRASGRRHEIQTSFGHAPVGKKRLKLLSPRKYWVAMNSGSSVMASPSEHAWQQGFGARSPKRPCRRDKTCSSPLFRWVNRQTSRFARLA